MKAHITVQLDDDDATQARERGHFPEWLGRAITAAASRMSPAVGEEASVLDRNGNPIGRVTIKRSLD